MSIRINSNLASLQSQRRLAQNTSRLSDTYRHLSSGLRINSAADDAAGLAVFTSLSIDARALSQAARNIGDAISMTNIQQSALSELQNVMLRQSELAEQAASGVVALRQRQALAEEADSLTNELNRIVRTTSFNGTKVLDGSQARFSIQSGLTSSAVIDFSLPDLSSMSTASAGGSGGGEQVGDGTFASAVSFSTRAGGSVSVGADLNNDGRTDFISGAGEHIISFINNGNGSFSAASTYWTYYSQTIDDLVTGDFNNDGVTDFAAAVYDEYYGYETRVMLGNGNGSFYLKSNIVGGGSMQVNDLDGDGKQDLVFTSPFASEVTLLYGNGNGTFKTPVTLAASGGPSDVAVADFNGDGILDLAVDTQNENIKIFRGLGAGAFAAPTTVIAAQPYGMTAADLNGDGRADLITSNIGSTQTVFLNNGNGTFLGAVTYYFSAAKPELGDFNGDGSLDWAALSGNKIVININDGTGTFTPGTTVVHSASLSGGTAADFNSDGVLDLLAISGQWINMFYGNNAAAEGGGAGGGTSTTDSELPAIDLRTAADAKASLATIASTRTVLSRSIGTVGAIQSRLNGALQTARVIEADYANAASRIGDADAAQESAELLKGRILQESAVSVLAQANQQVEIGLRLIRGA